MLKHIPLLPIFALVAGVASASGCLGSAASQGGLERATALESTIVRNRAARDLNCRRDAIRIARAGGDSWEAVGCGRKATYLTIGCDGEVPETECRAILSTAKSKRKRVRGGR